jgi:hypothetical protein
MMRARVAAALASRGPGGFIDTMRSILEGPLIDAGASYVISPVLPDEVVHLTLRPIPATTMLEWTAPNRALAYNVYRGVLSVLKVDRVARTSSMTQLACGITTDSNANGLPDTTDPSLPPLGDGYFYLVTSRNLTGEGPLGTLGAAPPRINDGQCP